MKEKTKNFNLTFYLYLIVQIVVVIIKELEKCKILSLIRKEKRCKRTINIMLINEKYTGDVKLLKSHKSEFHYLASNNYS